MKRREFIKNYFKLFSRSVFGYRINGFYEITETQLNSQEDIRGIKIAEIRGDYGY